MVTTMFSNFNVRRSIGFCFTILCSAGLLAIHMIKGRNFNLQLLPRRNLSKRMEMFIQLILTFMYLNIVTKLQLRQMGCILNTAVFNVHIRITDFNNSQTKLIYTTET